MKCSQAYGVKLFFASFKHAEDIKKKKKKKTALSSPSAPLPTLQPGLALNRFQLCRKI